MLNDRDNWYEDQIQKNAFDTSMKKAGGGLHKLQCWVAYNRQKLFTIFLWMVFIVSATVVSYIASEDFVLVNALYFAVSSLSTGILPLSVLVS